MSGHALSPGLLGAGFAVFFPMITVLVRKWPATHRPMVLIGGFLMIGLGAALMRLFLNVPGREVTGWVLAILGAFLLFVAGPGWRNFRPLEQDGTDAVLKPAANRPLRHFGDTP